VTRDHSSAKSPLQRGFSLIELVLTLLILGIIAAVVSQYALQGIRSYSGEQDRGDAHAQARLAAERLAREVRAIRSATAADIPIMAATDLQFTDSLGQTIRFTWAANVLARNGQTLAVNVTSFAFTFLQADGATAAAVPADLWFVQIALTAAQGATSLPLRVRVHPRNF
jgi:prepilin-type N-terminal cleavage/methylation domain-containing protein